MEFSPRAAEMWFSPRAGEMGDISQFAYRFRLVLQSIGMQTEDNPYLCVFRDLRGAVGRIGFRGDGFAWDVFQEASQDDWLILSTLRRKGMATTLLVENPVVDVLPGLGITYFPWGVYRSQIEETMPLFVHQIEEAYSALEGGDDAEFQSVVSPHLCELGSLAEAQYEDLRYSTPFSLFVSKYHTSKLCDLEFCFDTELEAISEPDLEAGSELKLACNALILVLAVALYSLGCLLLGYVNTKAFSSRSVHFRGDTYIGIVLFLGSYSWIKSRQAAPNIDTPSNRKRKARPEEGEQRLNREGVHCIPIPDGASGTRYIFEPVFTPPRWRDEHKRVIKPSKLSLGRYDTFEEALVVRRLAAYFYHGEDSPLVLDDGSLFSIPPISQDERSSLSDGGENSHPLLKRKWITQKVMEVYVLFQKEKAGRKKQSSATMTDAHFSYGRDAGSDPAASAVDVATCSVRGISNPADEWTSVSEDEPSAFWAAFFKDHPPESMFAPADHPFPSFVPDVDSGISEQPSSFRVLPGEMDDVIPEVDGHIGNLPDQSGLIANAATSEHVRQLQVNPSPVSRNQQGDRAAAIVVCQSSVPDGLPRQAESLKETRDTRKEELLRKLMDISEEEQEAAHKKQIAELQQGHRDQILKLHQEYQDRISKLERENASMQGVILQAFKVLSSHAGK